MLLAVLIVSLALQLLLLLFGVGKRLGNTRATMVLGLSAGYLCSGIVLRLLFGALNLSIDADQGVLWTAVCVVSFGLGVGSARVARRIVTLDFVLAAVLTITIAAIYATQTPAAADIASAPWRSLLIAPPALLLFSYFGASVGYLVWAAGDPDVKLGYEAMIGRRFLLSKGSSVLSVVTTISVFGVALGVWLVIIALGILGGFEDDLQRKIIGAGAHAVLQQQGGWAFDANEAVVASVGNTRGVTGCSPFVEGEVAIASQSNYTGGLVYGIDAVRAPEALTVLRQITHGSLQQLIDEAAPRPPTPASDSDAEFLPPAPVPHIVIGREMASSLNVGIGDHVRVISPLLDEMTPLGMMPKSKAFRVSAIFSSQMYEFDARFAYVSLPAARDFFELSDSAIGGIHVATQNPERSDEIAGRALAAISELLPLERGWEALDWKSRNQTLFAALKLERVVAFVVLVFIILVASFSIVSTLTMSVIEKKKEIAIIKTMGARDVGVMKLFLVQGLLVGVFGTLLGALVAVVTAILLKRIGFGIPGEVYYIDSLPVHVSPLDVVLIVLAALVIVWDFAVFPAIRGSQLEPVEGLRDG